MTYLKLRQRYDLLELLDGAVTALANHDTQLCERLRHYTQHKNHRKINWL